MEKEYLCDDIFKYNLKIENKKALYLIISILFDLSLIILIFSILYLKAGNAFFNWIIIVFYIIILIYDVSKFIKTIKYIKSIKNKQKNFIREYCNKKST